MPVTAIINMRALNGGKMPRSFHCLMHPFFLDRIAATDARLGEALHNSRAMAPFSISPIMGRKSRGDIIQNETYWARICILDSSLEEIFYQSLEKGLWSEAIRLGDLSFAIEDIIFGREASNPWAGRKPYEEILSRKSNSKKILLRIVSPMSFKRGDLHYPLPDPGLIFSNLARRWNRFSKHQVPEKVDCPDVGLCFFNLKTERYPLRKGGTVIGATGEISFVFRANEEAGRYYGALLDFAFFSGVGVKTTQGMGMCRIIREQ